MCRSFVAFGDLPALLTLSTSLCSDLCIALRGWRVQTEPPGSAVAWWFPAIKGCLASPTCPLKPKMCGRSRGSRCSSSSGSGTGSLGRSGWVRIQSPPEDEGRMEGAEPAETPDQNTGQIIWPRKGGGWNEKMGQELIFQNPLVCQEPLLSRSGDGSLPCPSLHVPLPSS